MAANGQVGPPGSPYAHVTSQRNAMTEAESMESLASLANGRASALKSEMGHLGSPGKHGVHSLMSGRKPRIHAASPSMRSGLRSAKDVDGDIFSSSLSLMSNASGVMVHGEDRHSQEIRKLRRELDSSNDKVVTLTSQLTTNAHMVAAFEQSLLAMTSRLQQQTALSERKESELNMLKMLVDELNECRKQNGGGDGSRVPGSLSPGRGHHHRDHGHHKDKRKDKAARKGALIRRHTFALASEELAAPPCGKKQGKLLDRNCQTPDQGDTTGGNKPTGWLRSSLSRAFRKSPKTPSSGNMVTSPTTPVKLRSGSCCELQNGAGGSLPSSPAHSRSGHMLVSPEDQLIEKLRQQLTEKERQVTELRLEALTSAHQLDSLNETLGELRRQLGRLTLENDRLRSLVTPSGVTLTPSNSTHSSNSTSSKVQNNSLDDNNAS
ncbi:Protein sickie [Halotydeus destructor]|nr:Protein sickie [Halotydeus destructor]